MNAVQMLLAILIWIALGVASILFLFEILGGMWAGWTERTYPLALGGMCLVGLAGILFAVGRKVSKSQAKAE